MNATTLIGLLSAIIEIILVFSVIKTAENTREMNETLNEIKSKLDSMGGRINGQGPVSKYSRPQNGDSWVCNCGARNYNSKTCTKCGASKDKQ